MIRSGRNIMVKVLLLLCIALQVMAAMPHHHHNTGGSACLGYSHKAQHIRIHNNNEEPHDLNCNQDEDHKCEGHRLPIEPCDTPGTLVARPELRLTQSDWIPQLLPCNCFLCVDFDLLAVAIRETVLDKQQYISRPDVEPVLIGFISTARPARAPDFTV